MEKLKLINGVILTPDRILRNSVVLLNKGKIEAIVPACDAAEDYREIDCHGNYISPGFIDIHVHGGGGFDFMDGDAAAILGAAKAHAAHGTTSIVPTGLASQLEQTECFFDAFREAKGEKGGANLLGIHLEGPYYAPEFHGAIELAYLRDPTPEHYEKLLSMTDDLKIWSEAPELPGSMAFGRCMERHGVIPSVGHSGATFEQVLEARENGFHHITHLYSCTSTVSRKNCFRVAGIVEAAFYCDDITVEIIADGVHLPPALLKLIYKLKGADKIALISDSMRGAGMPDGESVLGCKKTGQKVIIKDHIAWLPDGSGFAGGTGTSDRLVRNMIQLAAVPVTDAVRMMSETPARIIGERTKGKIAVAYDADIVVFNDNVDVQMTIVQGEIVFSI